MKTKTWMVVVLVAACMAGLGVSWQVRFLLEAYGLAFIGPIRSGIMCGLLSYLVSLFSFWAAAKISRLALVRLGVARADAPQAGSDASDPQGPVVATPPLIRRRLVFVAWLITVIALAVHYLIRPFDRPNASLLFVAACLGLCLLGVFTLGKWRECAKRDRSNRREEELTGATSPVLRPGAEEYSCWGLPLIETVLAGLLASVSPLLANVTAYWAFFDTKADNEVAVQYFLSTTVVYLLFSYVVLLRGLTATGRRFFSTPTAIALAFVLSAINAYVFFMIYAWV